MRTGTLLKLARRATVVAATMPLLASPSCIDIAQGALVNGFFQAVNPLLVGSAAGALDAQRNVVQAFGAALGAALTGTTGP